MAIQIRILGWEAKDLRCPDHKVSFQSDDSDTYRVSLLQMPNGTGKTTTLHMIRLALSGEGQDYDIWGPDKINEYRDRDNDSPAGEFSIHLKISDKKYTITVELDFVAQVVRYRTTKPSGQINGFHPPSELKAYFRNNYVNLFIFDGELAHNLLDKTHTNAQQAIDGLFNLSLFNQVENRINNYWEEKSKGPGATSKAGMTQLNNKIKSYERDLNQANRNKSNLEKTINSDKLELQTKENNFKDAISQSNKVKDEITDAENKLKTSEVQLSDKLRDTMALFRSPQNISDEIARKMIDFKNSLDKVRLPESTAREFFEELSEDTTCVCGRQIGEVEKEYIRSNAGKYLGSDDVAFLNSLKSDISTYLGDHYQGTSKQYRNELEELIAAESNRASMETEYELVKSQALEEDPELEGIQKSIKELSGRITVNESKLSTYSELGHLNNIKQIESHLKRFINERDKAQNTVSLRHKKDRLSKLLEAAQKISKAAIIKDLVVKSNQSIEKILPHNRIRIDSIDGSLKLQGQAGGSVGETLSVGYAFLHTLFNQSQYELPFVVDSPANPIDTKVREEVAKTIPGLTKQFVAFTISTEREGFIQPLEKAVKEIGESIQYITLFRKGYADVDKKFVHSEDYMETANGVKIAGRKYYMQFHSDEDEK